MQARCPSCHNLFNTERLGLQFCPSCGRQISVAQEAPGPAPETTARIPTPWEERAKLGPVQGYLQTWKRSMLSPEPFWRSVRPEGPWQDALFYGWITAALTALLQLPFQIFASLFPLHDLLLGRGQDLSRAPELLRRYLETAPGSRGVGFTLGSFVAVILFFPLVQLFVTAVLHALCLLLGEGRRGFGATLRVVAYASGPSLLGFIPCVGIFTVVYVLLQEVLGLKHLHEMKIEKAALAVILPLLGVCCCAGAILAAVGGTLFGLGAGGH